MKKIWIGQDGFDEYHGWAGCDCYCGCDSGGAGGGGVDGGISWSEWLWGLWQVLWLYPLL